MTVAELIEKLLTLPPDLTVLQEVDGLYFAMGEPEIRSVRAAYEGAWEDGDDQRAVLL